MKRFIPFLKTPPRVAVIRLQGVIGTGRAPLNDAVLAPVIERAFRKGKPKAVALIINSPGGSPVQSALIAARIRRLADEKQMPVHAFVEDVAASGGYWLAAAADHIWADYGSIVGSIGVISAGFGAHEFLAKHGIERRVYTSVKSKSMLDPFKPENPEDIERLNSLLAQLHDNFIGQIQSRRGDKLVDNPDLFTGEVWIGQKAVEVGLADGVGHLETVMKARFGDKVRFRRYSQRRPMFPRFGAQLVRDGLSEIEERAEFARFGL